MGAVSDIMASIRCTHCGCDRWDRAARNPASQGKGRCSECRRLFSLPDNDLFNLYTPTSKIIEFLRLVETGVSLRSASDLIQVHRNTGMRILRATGTIRRCQTCGEPLTGNRFMFCCDEHQQWHQRPYDATANVMQSMKALGCSPHVDLAFKFASEISELNAAEYLGPCYEGVQQGCALGISDERELRKLARRFVKHHWGETMTHRTGSLDGRKEAVGFEPSQDYRFRWGR